MNAARRVIIRDHPFRDFSSIDEERPWIESAQWPGSWIHLDPVPPMPFVAAYRLDFCLEQTRQFRVHVSGDERYELFLDGHRITRGPARAPQGWWHFDTFDFDLSGGRHHLAARVWSLGRLAPWAQTSFAHGFLFVPEPEDLWNELATGRGPWRGKILPGYAFGELNGMGTGPSFDLDGKRLAWDWLDESIRSWSTPAPGPPGNAGFTLYIKNNVPWLRPSELPLPLDESRFPAKARALEGPFFDNDFLNLKGGRPLLIGARQKVRVVLDWCDYVAVYPALEVSGGSGATIRLGWCEAPANERGEKIDRFNPEAPINNLLDCFVQPCAGVFDTIRPDGGNHRIFEPLWWRCGRFVVLEIETAEMALTIEGLRFHETRFRFERMASWQIDDPRLAGLLTQCQRTVELCAHETFMDCPFWEQLQYAGDTRLQALCGYVAFGDDVLARRALRAFDASRHNRSGWPASSHPSNTHQAIRPFALAWVAMLHDFALWRNDQAFVREIMPGARAAMELWLPLRRQDGLIANPEGWNFLDGTGDLRKLRGPVHGALHWLLVGTLRQVSELERWLGEDELATRNGRLAREIAASSESFWDESTGLYADDLNKTRFSEHTNAFAILSGLLSPERKARVADALFDGPRSLTRTQIHATHYLFEAAAQCGRMDVFWRRLGPWFALAKQGYMTTPEGFGVTRSECHAWGAHPLFHIFASVGGVRPAAFGFDQVRFSPQPGPLKEAVLVLAHPRGQIRVAWSRTQSPCLTLPDGVSLAPAIC